MARRISDPLETVLRQVDERYLRPQPAAIREAKARADRLVTELHRGRAWMYQVVQVHDHGSVSRGTAIRYFNDLDRLVELDPDALRTRSGRFRSAQDTIGRMATHIRTRWGGLVALGNITVRAQDHSVGVWYPGSDLRIDLVPAIFDQGELLIPERGTRRWIVTHPGKTSARLARAKRAAPHAGIAIRLLKGWARARGRNAPIPSFAIEALVVDQAVSRPARLSSVIRSFFNDIADSDARRRLHLGQHGHLQGAITIVDPVSGNNITESLTREHRQVLIHASRRALPVLDEMEDAAADGRVAQAINAGRNLFVGRRYS